MPSLTVREQAELANWFQELENNDDLETCNFEQAETCWQQQKEYYQEQFFECDRI